MNAHRESERRSGRQLNPKLVRAVVIAAACVACALAATTAHAAENYLGWQHEFGTTSWDAVEQVATTPGGDVITVGETAGDLAGPGSNQGDSDVFVRKYSGSGTLLWTKMLGTSAADSVRCVTIDSTGDVYIGGATWGTFAARTAGPVNQGSADFFMAKISPDGRDVLWLVQDGTSGEDRVEGMAVDSDGRVWAGGYVYGSLWALPYAGGADALVFELNPADGILTPGTARTFGASGGDLIHAMAAAPSNGIVIVGSTTDSLFGTPGLGGVDCFAQRLGTGTSDILWSRQWGTGGDDNAYAVATDALGDVYVGGGVSGALPGWTYAGLGDAFVCRMAAADGGEDWAMEFGSSGMDSVSGVAWDRRGYLHVAGRADDALPGQTSNGNTDGFTASIWQSSRTSAAFSWVDQFGSTGFDEARGCATDSQGNLYVGGRTNGTLPGQSHAGDWDGFARQYAADLTRPQAAINAPAYSTDRSATRTFRVYWSAYDPASPPPASGVIGVDVECRPAPTGSWLEFAGGGASGSANFTGVAGQTYVMRAWVGDAALNSNFSPSRTVVVPYDQSRARFSSGWTTRTGSQLYLGSSRRKASRGASARMSFSGAKGLALIVTKSRSGGLADVYVGSTRVRRIDLYASSTKYRQAISIASYSSARSGTLKVVVVGQKRRASRGTQVELDGIAVRR